MRLCLCRPLSNKPTWSWLDLRLYVTMSMTYLIYDRLRWLDGLRGIAVTLAVVHGVLGAVCPEIPRWYVEIFTELTW